MRRSGSTGTPRPSRNCSVRSRRSRRCAGSVRSTRRSPGSSTKDGTSWPSGCATAPPPTSAGRCPTVPTACPTELRRGPNGSRRRHPGDGGTLVALLLNHLILQPGQAIFLDAGNLHAYLLGTGVEVMASSDNVVRGGLTTKHIDVDELLAVVDFSPLDDPVVRPTLVAPGTWTLRDAGHAVPSVTLRARRAGDAHGDEPGAAAVHRRRCRRAATRRGRLPRARRVRRTRRAEHDLPRQRVRTGAGGAGCHSRGARSGNAGDRSATAKRRRRDWRQSGAKPRPTVSRRSSARSSAARAGPSRHRARRR